MVILVKIDPITNPSIDAKLVASIFCPCEQLLDDSDFRNKYKYLVAYCEGKIVGTYCIYGVSFTLPYYGENRMVNFKLEDTDEKCGLHVKNAIQSLIDNKYPKIEAALSYCYLDNNDLPQLADYKCNCCIEDIPVLDSEKVLLQYGSDKPPVEASIPNDLWFRFKLTTTIWDFHNAKGVYYDIIYHKGNVKCETGGLCIPRPITPNEQMLNQIKHIICIFHQSPETAIEKIKNFTFISDTMRTKIIDFQFDTFCENRMINRVQHGQGVIRFKQLSKQRGSGYNNSLRLIYDALIF